MTPPRQSRLTGATEQTPDVAPSGASRRRFLGGLGGAAAAAMASGVLGAAALEPAAQAAAGLEIGAHPPTSANLRRKACCGARKNMADYWFDKGVVAHPVNGDEARYDSRIGNYSKSMRHNAF